MIETFLVSFTHAHKSDESLLLVGVKKPNQKVTIINALKGTDADELYARLTTVKKGEQR